MKSYHIVQHLHELAEKLGIAVREENLKRPGVRAKSGLVRIHGRLTFILDKRATPNEKIDVLADGLADMPIEEHFMIPAVREEIERHRDRSRHPAGELPSGSPETEKQPDGLDD